MSNGSEGTDIKTYAPATIISHKPKKFGQIKKHFEFLKKIKEQVMIEDVDYGVIPGCKKPSAFKEAAEILAEIFDLGHTFQIQKTDLDDGHREYEIITDIIHIPTGMKVGQGVGSCTTMEPKYRYESGPAEFTDKPVPQRYWDIKGEQPEEARKLIGGIGYITKKDPDDLKFLKEHGTPWKIARRGARVEVTDPSEKFNTVLKIGAKRSYIHGILLTTRASRIFNQDVMDEDMEVDFDTPTDKKKSAEDFGKKAAAAKNGFKKHGNGGKNKDMSAKPDETEIEDYRHYLMRHFENPDDMQDHLLEVTTNEEKGISGFKSLEYIKSCGQLFAMRKASERILAGKKSEQSKI